MSLPFLSICIPAYKRPEHLTRLLTSIETQIFKGYEVIITDDSPDNSVQNIVGRFSHLPIQYFKNDHQLGSPLNWNEAIKRSKTDWIQLMHSDDWYASAESLQKLVEVAKAGNSQFIFSASREINALGKEIKLLRLDKKKANRLADPLCLVSENVIGHPSVAVYRKDISIEYDPAFRWVVDIDFYIRFLQRYKSYQYIDEPLINIGVDETMISHSSYKNPDVEIPEYLNLLNKFASDQFRGNPFVFYCLWNLVKKFRIKDENQIKQHGYKGRKIDEIDFIINCQKRIPRLILKQTNPSRYLMKRCYKKFIKQLQYSSA